MNSQKERFIYLIILLIFCLVSFGLGCYVFYKTSIKETRQIPINESTTLNVFPLSGGDVVVQNSYVGFVEAINQVQIIPYIAGYLKNIYVSAGQTVKEGDLLLTIDDGEYKAKLDAAEAVVLQAEASFQYNKNYYERVQKSGTRAFSEIEIDNARNNFLQAKATLENAKANKNLAEVIYHYTSITASISGVIGNFTLSSGDYVTPDGTALLSIVQTDPIRVVFSLTDKEYLNMIDNEDGELFKNIVIKLKLANGQSFEHNGSFKYTDNQLNKQTNSLAIYAYFNNEKNLLLPNSFVTVEVFKTFKNTVLIDKNYVKMKTNGSFVTIARNNKILSVKIDIIGDKNTQYVVKNTFQTGDLLVLDDTSNLKEGDALHFNIIK